MRYCRRLKRTDWSFLGAKSKRQRPKEATNKNGRRRSCLTVLFQKPQVPTERTSVLPVQLTGTLISVNPSILTLNTWWFPIAMILLLSRHLSQIQNILWLTKSGTTITLCFKSTQSQSVTIQEQLWWLRTFQTSTLLRTYPMKLTKTLWTVTIFFTCLAILRYFLF